MKNHNFISAALFAGIMAILSQFAFPIGAVPITLQSLSVRWQEASWARNGAPFPLDSG